MTMHTGVGVAAVLAVCCAVAGAEPSAGSIVFSSDRSGSWRIWTISADGSGMKPLSKDAADDEHDVDPAFSPDGRSVLFTSTRGGATAVWRMRRDGTHPERIAEGDQAEWAPDGTKIVFRRNGRIVTRVLATGKETRLTPEAWDQCSGPAWSPDGKTIAFARRAGGANAIFTVPAGGGAPAKVYDEKGACEPHWAPDGARILYETETHLCTIRPDGTKNRLLTYFGGVQRYGRHSPDGSQVVFCQAPSPRGPWELYVIGARSGTPRRLTEGGSDMYPDWK